MTDHDPHDDIDLVRGGDSTGRVLYQPPGERDAAAVDTSDTADTADGTDDEPPISGQRRRRRHRSSRRNAIEWAVVIGGALVVAILIKTLLFQAFYIPSSSMEPTLKIGDRVLVNKLSYDLHDVHRGDIVVFKRPPQTPQRVDACDGTSVTINPRPLEEDTDDLIKRVIALPGETVEQRSDGHIYVNGSLLNEPYLAPTQGTPPRATWDYRPQCIRVPANHVFVMGDNGTNSSASNSFGPIDESLIVGRAFIRVWPLGSLGGL